MIFFLFSPISLDSSVHKLNNGLSVDSISLTGPALILAARNAPLIRQEGENLQQREWNTFSLANNQEIGCYTLLTIRET